MRNNWGIMDGSSNKQNEFKIFEGYQLEMKNYIQNVGLILFRKLE